jgi:magnesium chelatase family protein
MPLARLISRGQSGLDAYEVSVEVHLAGGLPGFTITGLPAPAVRESRERVRAALQNCGIDVPASRITAHLGPADIPKLGGRFDLPIALGIIAAQRRNSRWRLDDVEFVGELSLGGELRPVTGAVPAAIAARAAKRRLIVPEGNAVEAGLVPGADVASATCLNEVVASLDGRSTLEPVPDRVPESARMPIPDLDDVRGHATAKRALCIAAAGGHNLLMIGPPGSGKSMLAARIRCLLPDLTDEELLSAACIASVAGNLSILEQGRARPFRAPHHTTRAAALIGGGPHPRPGEISLAHHGVLFLDELPEFSREALEAMREPLQTGCVAISRLGHRVDFPASFQLIAAMNPCPCGHYADGTEKCRCPDSRIRAYRSRISGPLLDRFDLHIEVPQVPFREFDDHAQTTDSGSLRETVTRARARQAKRGCLNARLSENEILREARLDSAARDLLSKTQERWQLSSRSVVRVLKLARTIADIAEQSRPGVEEIAEALSLRHLDRPSSGADTV